MPALIKYIDAIARERQCAVLYLEFHPLDYEQRRAYRHESDPLREELLAWLDTHGYAWQPCGPNASAPGAMSSWRGQVWLDVAFDEALPAYCKLRDHLEYPDGSMRHPGARFYVQPLAHAMENAAHDAPGYWARWADNF